MNTSVINFDSRELRNAFGTFGTGVTVVTSRNMEGRLVGVTANSFSSVSLEPPIVLWSLVKKSPSLDVFQESGRFVINILSLDKFIFLSNSHHQFLINFKMCNTEKVLMVYLFYLTVQEQLNAASLKV